MRRNIEKQGNILPCYDTYIKRYGTYSECEKQYATADKSQTCDLSMFLIVSPKSKKSDGKTNIDKCFEVITC